MRYLQRNHSLLVLLASLGTLALVVGFFSPWLIIDLGDSASLLGGILSGGLGISQFDLSNLLRVEINGWDIVTGITTRDFLGPFGSLVDTMDPSIMQQRITPPIPGYLFLPLVGIALLVVILYGKLEWRFLVVGGGISIFLTSIGIYFLFLLAVYMLKYNIQLYNQDFLSMIMLGLIQFKIGSGVYLILIGGIFWLVVALIEHNNITNHLRKNKWALSSIVVGLTSLFLSILLGAIVAIGLGWISIKRGDERLFALSGIGISIMAFFLSLYYSLDVYATTMQLLARP